MAEDPIEPGIEARRAAPPVPALQFVFETSPPEETPVWCEGPEPPLRILVIDDFLGRPDPRFVEDRLRGGWTDPFMHLKAAERTAGPKAKVAPKMRRSWRSLRWLVGQVPDGTEIWPLSATAADLVDDLQDAPRLRHSGLWKTISDRNHPGMLPYFAVVLGFPLDRIADAYLIGMLAQIGRLKNVPILVPTNETFAEERPGSLSREAPEARYLVFCAPEFILERKDKGDVLGYASFLVAARLAQNWARFGAAGDLRGELQVELARPVTVSQSILAWERGLLTFVGGADGARLIHDATFGAHPTPELRSLSWLHLTTRIALHALRLHPPPCPHPREAPAFVLCASATAEAIERGLAHHLRPMPAVSVALRDARWLEPPLMGERSLDFAGVMEVELVITVAAEEMEPLTLHERVALRFEP